VFVRSRHRRVEGNAPVLNGQDHARGRHLTAQREGPLLARFKGVVERVRAGFDSGIE
jgi:hypothetical protein